MRYKTAVRLSLPGLAGVLLLLSSLLATELPTNYYYFQGKRVDLTVDRSRLAIPRDNRPARAAGLSAAVATLGIARIESIGRDDLVLAEFGSPLNSDESVFERIDRVARELSQFVAPVLRTPNGEWASPSQRILLKLADHAASDGANVISQIVPSAKVEIADFAGLENAYTIISAQTNGFAVMNEANRLAEDPRIEWAEPDFNFSAKGALVPNDSAYSSLWGLNNTGQLGGVPGQDMRCEQAWDISLGDSSVKILLLETGVELTHPDLNVILGQDFAGGFSDGGPEQICDNHGTMMAGCMTAKINNTIGVVGVAPKCVVLPARIGISTGPPCNNGWSGQLSWTANALNWGLTQGARVSNNPNVWGIPSNAVAAVYTSTKAAGMIHFAPAGDVGGGFVDYPAKYSSINSVSAITPTGAKANFSNYGGGLELCAPGVSIVSTDRTGTDGYVSGNYSETFGSSLSCSYAAAVAALVIARNPGATVAQIEQRLFCSARDLGAPGYDTTFGYGCVDAYSAIATLITDTDTDGVDDLCDNCAGVTNPDQADIDHDAIGDLCDDCVDPDADGYASPGFPATTCTLDNCPGIANPGQEDANNDGIGDACCCINRTGNVDCDPADGVDISDLAALIDNLYISFSPLCCPKEANIDGQPGTDIADLSTLIDYLYISFTPTAACQ